MKYACKYVHLGYWKKWYQKVYITNWHLQSHQKSMNIKSLHRFAWCSVKIDDELPD